MMKQYGSVTISKACKSSELKKLLPDYLRRSEAVIVKPSWYSTHFGNFTDAETLRVLLEALEGRAVIVESYTLDRQDGSMKFTVQGKTVDWNWILKHPDWNWVKEDQRWEEFRKQDRWFLDTFGFTDLFKERGVEYVNVTEEVWSKRTTDADLVKQKTESKFKPAFTDRLYTFVPERLYRLEGAPLISYGKVKGIHGSFPSLTMKNLFGLIPDPLRAWWHGQDNVNLGRSIVDINKIYYSIFNIFGICEAIRYATISNPKGEVKAPWGSYSVARNLGIVALGPCLSALDATLCVLIGTKPENVSYLQLAEDTFGHYDRDKVEEAKHDAPKWFPNQTP